MDYHFPEAMMQLQLWPDEDMPEMQGPFEEELQQEIEQEKQYFLTVQLYLPGFEQEEND